MEEAYFADENEGRGEEKAVLTAFPSRLPIPSEVLRIAEALENAGFETWCVGGAVRDNLLGFENSDYDLATSATPDQVRDLFRHTVPIGVTHGTVAVLDRSRQAHEVTTFRKDVTTDGRHAVVEFGASLEEDLARRDFTINAIAYHPMRHEWVDRYGGQDDLRAKLLKAVGDPDDRFKEDFLRILRVFRFASRFGFEIDAATWSAAKRQIAGIEGLSAERVRGEWMRGVEGAQSVSGLLRLWRESGAAAIWLGELGEGGGGREAVVDGLPRQDAVLITCYLSADPAVTLARLRCSNREIERGRRIGALRDDYPSVDSPVEVRRWMARAAEAVDDLVVLAKSGADLARAVSEVRASGAPLTLGDLAVDGTDLMEIGVAPGPALGNLLADLLEEVLVDPALNTNLALLERAAALRHAG